MGFQIMRFTLNPNGESESVDACFLILLNNYDFSFSYCGHPFLCWLKLLGHRFQCVVKVLLVSFNDEKCTPNWWKPQKSRLKMDKRMVFKTPEDVEGIGFQNLCLFSSSPDLQSKNCCFPNEDGKMDINHTDPKIIGKSENCIWKIENPSFRLPNQMLIAHRIMYVSGSASRWNITVR